MSTEPTPIEDSLVQLAGFHAKGNVDLGFCISELKSSSSLWSDIKRTINEKYAEQPVGLSYEVPLGAVFDRCEECEMVFNRNIVSLLHESGLLVAMVPIQECRIVCFTSAAAIVDLCHNFFTNPPRPNCTSLTCKTTRTIRKNRLVAQVNFHFAKISLRVRFYTRKEIL